MNINRDIMATARSEPFTVYLNCRNPQIITLSPKIHSRSQTILHFTLVWNNLSNNSLKGRLELDLVLTALMNIPKIK